MSAGQQTFPWLPVQVRAVLSADEVYRYELWRSLDAESVDVPRPTVAFMMLNPSKADALQTDPTFEKCMKYGRRWGYGRIVLINLFAFRETDSTRLASLASKSDIIGPDNDTHLRLVLSDPFTKGVVLGWGRQGHLLGRSEAVLKLLKPFAASNLPIWYLARTDAGEPSHPLYQRDDVDRGVWSFQ